MKHLQSILVAGVLATCALSSCKQQQSCCADADEPQLIMGDNIAVANTKYGKVKGYILRDTYTFLGIPYGQTTAGEGRFMPAKEPTPWEGIRPTVFYGPSAPQNMDNKWGNGTSYYSFSDHWNYYDTSEDCLYLNVWTPQLADGGKRPVMVWLHGGGYAAGNGIEQDGYNGENFSKYGNAVFVSLNHRLNAFGFSDFSAVDPKFKDSGNVGMLDIVQALKWVKENIANFGGDPDNVTIMGQSGGGGKVCTLVGMPETKGLISKAVALSGNSTNAQSQEATAAFGKFMWEKAGKDMSKLQNMPWEEYYAFANAALREFQEKNPSLRPSFAPIADGIHIPTGNYFTDASAPAAQIPMIFCTTTCENSASRTDATLEEMNREQAIEYLGRTRRMANAEEVFDAFNAVFPDQKPIAVVGLVGAARTNVLRSADSKASTNTAPVYLAWFGWEPPLFDGRMRAFHCLDICFWFKNTDLMLSHTGGGKRPRDLSIKMTDALLSFMRTGTPSAKGLPEWPAYTSENGATMYLNDECQVLMAPDREALKTLNLR